MPTQTEIEKLDPNFALAPTGDGLRWYDIRGLGVEGRGWPDAQLATPYDRFPAKAQGVVRDPVWRLGQHSAGMYVRFVTDARSIAARWSLRFEALAMPHMPATGVSGLDLYAWDGKGWRWCATGRPSQQNDNQASLVVIAENQQPAMRQFMLHLPLYNGVTSVAIGLSDNAALAKAPPAAHKPICFYGTSIVQGGCASRPGMAYPAIIGRALQRPTINLGFSGNAKIEPEVASLLAELDPSVYVLDPLPNNQAAEVAERMPAFVRTLRTARPNTPIVLVESITYQGAWLNGNTRATDSNAVLRRVFDALVAQGVAGLHYVSDQPTLLGDDGEGAVDGTHPTDVGFVRMAEKIGKAVAPLI